MKNFLETDNGRTLLESFLKTKSDASRRVYKSEINQFFRHYGGRLEAITEKDLVKYRDSFGKKANPKTVKRKFSMISGFLKYAEKHVKGYHAPIGQQRGDLVQFSAVDYTESQSFRSLLDNFLSGIIKEKSRATYRNHLIQSFRHFGKEPKHITTVDLIDYHTALMREADKGKRAKISIWGRFITLQKFFGDYTIRNKGFENPLPNHETIPGLEHPGNPRDRTSILSLEELERFFKAARKKNDLRSIRDHAFFKLQFYMALRVSEVCNLRYGDIIRRGNGWDWHIIIWNRKSKVKADQKDTPFELIREISEPLDWWIKESRYPFKEETPVFLPIRYRDKELEIDRKRALENRPLSTRVMQEHFVSYLKQAGIDPERSEQKEKKGRVRTHSLRATMATLLTASGVPPVYLQYFLGQEPPGQLRTYVHYDYLEHNPLRILKKNVKTFSKLKRF